MLLRSRHPPIGEFLAQVVFGLDELANLPEDFFVVHGVPPYGPAYGAAARNAGGYVGRMQLTRERIIAAAVDLIERESVTAISMRRIAAELGCAVMSLYNHVPSKEALLDGVAEYVLSGIEVSYSPGASWQDQVRAQARAF